MGDARVTFKMGALRKIRRVITSPLRKLVCREVDNAMAHILPIMPQIVEYSQSPKELRQSFHDPTKRSFENSVFFFQLRDRLTRSAVPVEEVSIDIRDFERWLGEFRGIYAHYRASREACIEKCLEHYLVYRHLKLSHEDIYVDVASAASPFARILNSRGISSYSLDLSYRPGTHGRRIGADAAGTGLPAGFASAISAQCAYEHFQEEADVLFLAEADRILDERGRYAIVPLYLADTHINLLSPFCDLAEVKTDLGAVKVWREDRYRLPFSRFYSPESFARRIYSALPGTMGGNVLFFKNLVEVMQRFPGQHIYCWFMFCGEKRAKAVSGR